MGNCSNKADGVAADHHSNTLDDDDNLHHVSDELSSRLHRRGNIARANARHSVKEKRRGTKQRGSAHAMAATPPRASPAAPAAAATAGAAAAPTLSPPSPPPGTVCSILPPLPPASGRPAPTLLADSVAPPRNMNTSSSTTEVSPATTAPASDLRVVSLDSVAVRLEQGSSYVWLRQSYTNPHLTAKPLLRLGGLRQLRNRSTHFQQLWAVLGEAACMIGPYAAAAAATPPLAQTLTPVPTPPAPQSDEPNSPLNLQQTLSAVYDDNTPVALGLDMKTKLSHHGNSNNGGGGGAASRSASQSLPLGAAPPGRHPIVNVSQCGEEVQALSHGDVSIEGDAAHTHPLLCRGAVFRDKHIWIHNLRHRSCFVMEAMSGVDVHECTDSLLVLGPTAGAVSLSNCRRCCVIAAAGQVRMLSCESMLMSMTVTGLPVIEKCTQIGVAPLLSWYAYNDLPAQLRHAHLSPFTNNYSTIRDATPPTSQGPSGVGMLPPAALHRRSLSLSMSSGSIAPPVNPTPQSNFVYVDLWELEGAVWKALAEQRWAQLIAETSSSDAAFKVANAVEQVRAAAAVASSPLAQVTPTKGVGAAGLAPLPAVDFSDIAPRAKGKLATAAEADGGCGPAGTMSTSGSRTAAAHEPLSDDRDVSPVRRALSAFPVSPSDSDEARASAIDPQRTEATAPAAAAEATAAAAATTATAAAESGGVEVDFGGAEYDFRSMVSLSNVTASTIVGPPSSMAPTRTPLSSQAKGTSQSTNISSGSARIAQVKSIAASAAAGEREAAPPAATAHPAQQQDRHGHHLVGLPRWRFAGFGGSDRDAITAAGSGTSTIDHGAAAALRVRSSARAAEGLVRTVLRAVPLLPLSALPQAASVLASGGGGGASGGPGGAWPTAQPQQHTQTRPAASEEARAPHSGNGSPPSTQEGQAAGGRQHGGVRRHRPQQGSPASPQGGGDSDGGSPAAVPARPVPSPRELANSQSQDGSGGRKKRGKKGNSSAASEERSGSPSSPESPRLASGPSSPDAGAVAAAAARLPATNPLELLLAFYTHTCAVPATFGAQLIPADFFEQRWKLKLVVITNKNGGWDLAHRITRDIEECRRQSMLETLHALLHAPPPPLRREREERRSASAAGNDEPRNRRSSSRETTSTPPVPGEDEDDNDSFSEALYAYLRSTSLTQRCGPVLLLNTVELRCTETALREFVAPVFYKLCEPVGLSGAAASAKGPAGAKAQAKRSASSGGVGGGGVVGGLKLPWKHSSSSSNPATPSRGGQSAAAATAELEQNIEVRRLFGSAMERMSGQTCVALLALVAPKALPPSFQRPPTAGGRSSGGALTPAELAAWAQRAEQARRIFTPQPDPPDSEDDEAAEGEAEAARVGGQRGDPTRPRPATAPTSRGPTFNAGGGRDAADAAAAEKFVEERVWSKCVVLNVTVPTRFISLLQSTLFFKSQLLLASSAADVQRT